MSYTFKIATTNNMDYPRTLDLRETLEKYIDLICSREHDGEKIEYVLVYDDSDTLNIPILEYYAHDIDIKLVAYEKLTEKPKFILEAYRSNMFMLAGAVKFAFPDLEYFVFEDKYGARIFYIEHPKNFREIIKHDEPANFKEV